jgi:hypothetical protein
MAFHARALCFERATYFSSDQMHLTITIHDEDGDAVKALKQFCKQEQI